ncbi:MAG TPA: hypothetical protein EYP19_11725 [Desulfobacterales bacterium]|nr:hypothetical protein [Desulfobacterales bacterium]
MTEQELLLEVGSEAYNDLTTDEITAICTTYASSQKALGGMKAFELLMKKFQPTYRMGRMYKALSDKYEAYRCIYVWYTQHVDAGRLGVTEDLEDRRPVERYKWIEPTHRTQEAIDEDD